MKKRKTIYLLLTAVIIAIAAVSIWRLRPVTQEELRDATVDVYREDCYLLMSGNDTLLAFSGIDGDTLLLDGTADVRNVKRQTVHCKGLLVNGLPVIPSCRGRIMVMPNDTPRLCRLKAKQLQSVVTNETAYIDRLLHEIADQESDVAYYLKTHNVIDMGFDVVARTDKRLSRTADSLRHLSGKLKHTAADTALQIVFSPRYYAILTSRDSGKVKRYCHFVERRDGMIMLKSSDGMPDIYSTRISKYSTEAIRKALALCPKATVVLPKNVRIDSLGTYRGGLDSVRASHGYGTLAMRDGGYYEGEWQHGKRNGWGLALSPGKRLRIGEWKDDRFLGERIIYTGERIYGIDISRFQHEKGRKRFKIDWSNLAITSLGRLSKKKIMGETNFPISFIYIKSTEGTSIRNRYFNADYRDARRHGYKVGAYHFFSTRTGGAAQARYFLKYSRYSKGDFPPVLDLEPTRSQIMQMGGTAKMLKEVRQWLHIVEKARGVRPILYISQAFVRKYMSAAPDLIRDYNVWIARYGEYKPELNLVFWQLSPDGRVRGIRTEVDINVFNGFREEWEKFIK